MKRRDKEEGGETERESVVRIGLVTGIHHTHNYALFRINFHS